MNFVTENQNFRKIMANGLRYYVPRFQRDYAWEYEQWEDLWEDLQLTKTKEQHYMGYLVFQSEDNKQFSVIDGQQRLTTVSLLIIAALYNLQKIVANGVDADRNQQRLDQIKNSYIGSSDNVTLIASPKLTLNINNAEYYKSYICSLEQLPVRGITKSERQLQKAVSYFQGKIEALTGANDGEAIAAFVEGMVDKLLFTTITVGSDLNAYRVFETLNARGVQLSVPDLLKNYLFSLIDSGKKIESHELNELETRWQQILKQLGQVDFTKFVIAHWNSSHSSVSRSQLFRRLKTQVFNRKTAFEYINDLRKKSQIYAALHNSNDDYWKTNELRPVITALRTLNMFNVIQPFSMLLAAEEKLSTPKFVKVIKNIEVVSIRYNVIGSRQANTQEKVYNKIALELSTDKIVNVQGIKNALKEIYVSDDEFKSDFANKSMKTSHSNKKARYILARLELFASDTAVTDIEYTLEHILPETPQGKWVNDFGDDYNNYIDRIGNMCLLTDTENKEAARLPYNEKRKVYSQSNLMITNTVADFEVWTSDSVERRQHDLAIKAAECWSMQFS